jgi:hypothetical protein
MPYAVLTVFVSWIVCNNRTLGVHQAGGPRKDAVIEDLKRFGQSYVISGQGVSPPARCYTD